MSRARFSGCVAKLPQQSRKVMAMLKQAPGVLAVLLAGSSMGVGCGLKDSGGDDDSNSPSTGGAAVAFGGNTSTGGTSSVSTGGDSTIALGGSTSSTGGSIGTAGNGVFDGGSIPITEDQKDQIGSQACAGFLT